jgi:glycosyltransferase involved in cell wall biosynthesis
MNQQHRMSRGFDEVLNPVEERAGGQRQLRCVFVVTPWFPDHPDDWKYGYIYDSAAAIARQGVSVHVLVCRPFVPQMLSSFAPEDLRGAIDTATFSEISISTARYLRLPRGRLGFLTDEIANRLIAPKLRSLVLQSGADVIHAHTEGMAPLAVSVGAQLQVPCVTTIHGLNTHPRFVHNRAERVRMGRALAAADRVVLVGEPLRSEFAKLVQREDHFRIVHNGVRLPASRDRRPILQAQRPIEFITVSNLQEGKGIDIALRALAIAQGEGLTDWTFTVVGDGPEHAGLLGLANSLGVFGRVRFVGRQPHDRVYNLLFGADVFILPSYREAFGIAYLEAMAAGLVTVGVRGQGPDAFIADGKTGFLVEARSPRAVAHCILDIAAQPELARKVATAGAEFVRNEFTWDAHAGHVMNVYQELIG